MTNDDFSYLQKLRLLDQPQLPKNLSNLSNLSLQETESPLILSEIEAIFPSLKSSKNVQFILGESKTHTPKKVGVLFSGGQAAGGHNVIIGLFNALKGMNPASELIGFLGGPDGLIKNSTIKLHGNLLYNYLNQGGFDLLGSGRTKIETDEQFQDVAKTVKSLNLDGLVIVGGDDSNTNAAFLAEYFLTEHITTNVIGVPKTIDGDLKNDYVEIPFGFDTATKTYSDIISNIARDALSAKKYYYFVKLMGRTASHITLECALQVHPNMSLIGEEIEAQNKTIQDIVHDICDIIVERAAQGKDYGVVLIPEGLLEFVPEVKLLIGELNQILHDHDIKENDQSVLKLLSDVAKKSYQSLTKNIRMQLLQARDPHGNVQVSKIDTERFFIELVTEELTARKAKNLYKGKFNPQPIFCGYEGRSCFPSKFDCSYCMTLGMTAALLIENGLTGYMAYVKNLKEKIDDWQIGGVALLNLMQMELRKGSLKAVVKKAMVDLRGQLFKMFEEQRENWVLMDDYRYVGPIQFYGPPELTDKTTLTLSNGVLKSILYKRDIF